MRQASVQILSGADTGDVTGSAFYVAQAVSASFVPVLGDVTAAGTIKIQCSNDPMNGQNPANFTPTNWADIPNATSAISSGVGPAIVISNMCFQHIRAIYTRSGGGSTTVKLNMGYLSL